MNALEVLAGLDWWTVAGWTMLHYLWLGLVVGAVAAVLRFALRRASAQVRYAASVVCLGALAVLPVAVMVWVCREHDVARRLWRVVDVSEDGTPLLQRSIELPRLAPGSSEGIVVLSRAEGPLESELANEPNLPLIAKTDSDPGQSRGLSADLEWRTFIERAARWLPWVWIVGAPVTFLLLATGVVGAERLRRESRLVIEGPIVECLERLRGSLSIGRRVAVAVCERVATPVLVGVVRPMILLPPAALTGWSPDEIEMVLLHELAHVRRWDNFVNLLQRLVEAVLFFQPAVWLVSGWVRREREACCDAVVVGRTQRPQAYAELLVALAAQLPRSVLFHPAAASAMAAGPLRGRIRRILGIHDDPMLISGKSLGVVMSTLLLAATLVVLNLSTLSKAKEAVAGDKNTSDSVTEALDHYRQVVVGYDLDFDSVFPDRPWTTFEAQRLLRYPTPQAWPDVLGHVDAEAGEFREIRERPESKFQEVTGGNAFLVPLAWSVGTKDYTTLLLLKGIDADAHVVAHSYTSFASFGPMAGDVLFKSYATALVDGELTGQITADSYFNLVVTGKFTGRIQTGSYAMVYLMSGLAGEMELKHSKVYVAGRTERKALARIHGAGKVFLEESDLATGEHRIGELAVTVKSGTAEGLTTEGAAGKTVEEVGVPDTAALFVVGDDNPEVTRSYALLLKERDALLANFESLRSGGLGGFDLPFTYQASKTQADVVDVVAAKAAHDKFFTGYVALFDGGLIAPVKVDGANSSQTGTAAGLTTEGTEEKNRYQSAGAGNPSLTADDLLKRDMQPSDKERIGIVARRKFIPTAENVIETRHYEIADASRAVLDLDSVTAVLSADQTEPRPAWGFSWSHNFTKLKVIAPREGQEFIAALLRDAAAPTAQIGADVDKANGTASIAVPDKFRTLEDQKTATTTEGTEEQAAIQFVVGASRFADGDRITIRKVRGTASDFEPGGTYWIEGSYTLASRDRASLSAFVTARNAGDGRTSIDQGQTMVVERGSGKFALKLPMPYPGWPHVSFYPDGGGEGFGGVYFGTGDSVLLKWWDEKGQDDANTLRASDRVADSAESQTKLNLAKLRWALYHYQESKGALPAYASFDAEGKPLLSWRVHLLPFLGEDKLYREFRLDEPWDSRHNRRLLDYMPAVYRSRLDGGKTRTRYLAVLGPDCVFTGRDEERTSGLFANALLETIAIVAADKDRAVEWTKPEDWTFDRNRPTQGLGENGTKPWYGVEISGNVKQVAAGTPADAVCQLLSPGDVLGDLRRSVEPAKPGDDWLKSVAFPSPKDGEISRRAKELLGVRIVPAAQDELRAARQKGFAAALKILDPIAKGPAADAPIILVSLNGVVIADYAVLDQMLKEIANGRMNESLTQIRVGGVVGDREFVSTIELPPLESVEIRKDKSDDSKRNSQPAVAKSDPMRSKFVTRPDNPLETRKYEISNAPNTMLRLEWMVEMLKRDPSEPKPAFGYNWTYDWTRLEVIAPKEGQDFVKPMIFKAQSSTAALPTEPSSPTANSSVPTVTPSNSSNKFPTLEEQKLADVVWKRLGIELERINPSDLRRVQSFGYEGGLRVSAVTSRPGWQPIVVGDILVGLHVWPTTTLEEVAGILERDDLAELNPLKFYVVRSNPEANDQTSAAADIVFTYRISVSPGESASPGSRRSKGPWDSGNAYEPIPIPPLTETEKGQLRERGPVRLQFYYAPDSEPCRRGEERLAEIQTAFGDLVQIDRINVIEQAALAASRNVQVVPTSILFWGENRVAKLSGTYAVSDLERWLIKLSRESAYANLSRQPTKEGESKVAPQPAASSSASTMPNAVARREERRSAPVVKRVTPEGTVEAEASQNTYGSPPEPVRQSNLPAEPAADLAQVPGAAPLSVPQGSTEQSGPPTVLDRLIVEKLLHDPNMEMMRQELMSLEYQLSSQAENTKKDDTRENKRLRTLIAAKRAKIDAYRKQVREHLTIANQQKVALRYDGKTFDQWRTEWQTELSTEKRIEAVKALAAFGRAGYGKEAAAVILDVAGEYDFTFMQQDNDPEGKFKQSVIQVLAPELGRPSLAEFWLPDLVARMKDDPGKWRPLLAYAVGQLRTDKPPVIGLLKALAEEGPEEVRSEALGALVRSERISDRTGRLSEQSRRLLGEALASGDKDRMWSALWLLVYDANNPWAMGWEGMSNPRLFYLPGIVGPLLGADEEVRQQARLELQYVQAKDAPELLEQLLKVLTDDSRAAEHVEAIRAIAALGPAGVTATPKLKDIVLASKDEAAVIAAVLAVACINDKEVAAKLNLGGLSSLSITPSLVEAIHLDEQQADELGERLNKIERFSPRLEEEAKVIFPASRPRSGGGMF